MEYYKSTKKLESTVSKYLGNMFQESIPIRLRTKIYYIIINLCFILFLYSIIQIKWVVVDFNDFLGLTSHLTIYYWLGLSIITICSILVYLDNELKDVVVFIYSLFIVTLFLFGLGVFAEENARFIVSYYPTAEVKTVLETYHIDTISDYPLISYRSWPAFHLITASILYLSGISLNDLVKYMPLFWSICVIFVTFTIGRRLKLTLNGSFLLSFLLISSFWLPQYYYSPQSFAFIIYLILFICIFSQENINFIGLSLLTFSSLVIAHLVTSIVVILSLFTQELCKNRFSYTKLTCRNRFKYRVLLFIAIFTIWILYLAPLVFTNGVLEFKDQVMNLDLFSENIKFNATSETKETINIFRFSYLGIYALCGVISVILFLTRKVDKRYEQVLIFSYNWSIGVLFLILLNYGFEQFERVYMFCLVPAISIIILSISEKKFMILLMVLFIVLHIPAHYGSESYDMVYTSKLKGSEFLGTHISPDTTQGKYYSGHAGFCLVSYFNHNLVTTPRTNFANFKKYDMSEIFNRLSSVVFIIDDTQSDNYYRYYYNYNPATLYLENKTNQNDLHRLYANGNYNLFANKKITS